MTEGEFIPFAARRAAELTPEPARPEPTDDAPAREDPSTNDAAQVQTGSTLGPDAPNGDETAEAASDCADCTADVVPAPGAPAAPAVEAPAERPCDHSHQIRNEAVRLAAIACGRALRHAVMLHPGIIAAFVDDALAAAGHPAQARIRLHPDSIAAVEAPEHDLIADQGCAPGDVIIECEETTVGATVLERAELLVNAAAG